MVKVTDVDVVVVVDKKVIIARKSVTR